MVYIRMLHTPHYRSFLPEIYRDWSISVHAGRETVDISILDPDEIYDITYTRGITITGSPRIPSLFRTLTRSNDGRTVHRVIYSLFNMLEWIGEKYREKHLPSTYAKPFIIIDTPDNVLQHIIYKITEHVESGKQLDRNNPLTKDLMEHLLRNSRIIIIFHKWRTPEEIEDEARLYCIGTEDPWEYESCVEKTKNKIIEKEHPEILGAIYLVNGALIAKNKNIIKHAIDILPEYEARKLKEKDIIRKKQLLEHPY